MGKWVVCAAWPYVNTVPHLGNLIGSVLSADILARYLRMRGEEVVFVSGSDEHGTPIEVEARKKNIEPKELTDQVHEYVSTLFEEFEISFDNYTRTENPLHIEFVQSFLNKIYENGYIFSQEEEALYCPHDKIFLPDRFVEGKCPYCGFEPARGDQCDNCGRLLDPTSLIEPKCVLCSGKPEVKKSKHWYFDLPKLSDELKKYIQQHPRFPDNVKRYCLSWIREGLKPRAITRDTKWGVPSPFPSSKDKTVYVWFDALLGYLSATKEYGIKTGKPELWRRFWTDKETKTVYFIGKDNIPFHAIILPAMLLATREGYVLPWQVAATEYLTFEGEKFSKSRGVGVWIDEAIEMLDVDYWRFALVELRPEIRDSNFTWKEFYRIVNDDLNDDIGNFIHRVLTMVYKEFNKRIPEPGEYRELDVKFVEKLKEAPRTVGGYILETRYKLAVQAILEIARFGNKYLNEKAPWDKIKSDPKDAATTLYICTNTVRSLAILLYPFIPRTSKKIWELLNLKTSIEMAGWESAGSLELKPGHEIKKPKPVFKKLPKDFLSKVNIMLEEARRKVKRPKVLVD